jgi:hypothetical protein
MSADIGRQRKAAIAKSDDKLLAQLGYKQEFQREFKPLEVCRRCAYLRLRPAHII